MLKYKLTKRGNKFFIKSIEKATILAIFTKVKLGESLTLYDKLVMESFQRYSPKLQDEETLREYLNGLSDSQLQGVVSNVKGILHEIEFAARENNDFDSVRAALFQDTNHEGFDIQLFDKSTGESWEVQLKATDSAPYVEEWLENNNGDLYVTEELASKYGFESSGFSNEELTKRVEEFINHSINEGDKFNISMFEYFPGVTSLAIGIMIWQLYVRKNNKEISEEQFKELLVKHTGEKLIKITAIMTLLSIPGLNIATASYLIYRFVTDLNSSGVIKKLKNYSSSILDKFKTI